MKVLVLGSRIPYPLHDGGAKASYQLLKTLANLGHEITFFSFNTKKHFVSNEIIKEKFSFCEVISCELDGSVKPLAAAYNLLSGISYNLKRFDNKSANKKLVSLLAERTFDCIHFESLFTIPFLATIKDHHKGYTILRQHNAENKIWKKLANASSGFKKWYLNILAKQLKREEEACLSNFDIVVGISQEDSDYFKTFNANTEYISVAQEMFEPIESLKPNALCHIGSMEWQPNVQAVEWFLTKVWEKVLAQNPKAEFHLAGKGLNKEDSRFNRKGVTNHGEVPNANEFLRNHGLLVIPLQSASGVRMKALEAMAHGIPIVSTTVGTSGLVISNQKEVVLANTSTEFIKAINSLISQPENALEMGLKGQIYVNLKFSEAALSEQWNSLYSKIPNQ